MTDTERVRRAVTYWTTATTRLSIHALVKAIKAKWAWVLIEKRYRV